MIMLQSRFGRCFNHFFLFIQLLYPCKLIKKEKSWMKIGDAWLIINYVCPTKVDFLVRPQHTRDSIDLFGIEFQSMD